MHDEEDDKGYGEEHREQQQQPPDEKLKHRRLLPALPLFGHFDVENRGRVVLRGGNRGGELQPLLVVADFCTGW